MGSLVLAYIRQGDCPNWSKALATATKKMGCKAGSQPLSGECQRRMPCDVCQFLKEDAWPPARIVEFPAEELVGKRNHTYGSVAWDQRWKKSCPLNDTTYVEFKRALCHGDGIWGLDKVDILAKAVVHEALHLCKAIGAVGAVTVDLELFNYLICPGPRAADLVDICWEHQHQE